MAGYTAVHNGWGRGCFTNRPTGFCILLSKRFQPRMIKEVSFPPTLLAGRGGATRLKGGATDLGISAYCSPLLGGCSGARRKVQLTAFPQLMARWDVRGVFVGEFHNASQNETGGNFVEMSMSLELGFLNTMWRTGGPTCCGLAGHRSTIDHILVSLSVSECVKKVVTCWKLGRKLQLIPAAHPQDHLTVLVLLAVRMRWVGRDQQRTRWDSYRMAIALQQGSAERESFLKELDNNLRDQSDGTCSG